MSCYSIAKVVACQEWKRNCSNEYKFNRSSYKYNKRWVAFKSILYYSSMALAA
ncbi:hypothetical protein PEDI_19510 [Persicobacter diffluens]|uniref:Uncharacterized protein n=1 Tax=Persicobacter diffluens TaxID=981 RepID=A0AAN4VY52_9BACT|nr:hypothetical protein PEDI_19510 [Persicobacter diffluens]